MKYLEVNQQQQVLFAKYVGYKENPIAQGELRTIKDYESKLQITSSRPTLANMKNTIFLRDQSYMT